MALESIISRYQSALDTQLRQSLREESATPELYDLLRYHMGWHDQDLKPASGSGGKRLRPILTLICCEAMGGDYRLALPAAAAIELLHNFSLIHDDIEDRSVVRWSRPTLWTLRSEPVAINAGDAMHVLAYLALFGDKQSQPTNAVAKSVRLLLECCLRITEGQHLDLDFSRIDNVRLSDYYAMISRKSAGLIGCAMQIGVLIGGADDRLADTYRQLGENLGKAFQIRDDMLGLWGDERVTGKSTFDDLIEGKKTLPLLRALDVLPADDVNHIRLLYQRGDLGEAGATQIRSLIEATDAQEFSNSEARRFFDEAMIILSELRPADPAGSHLRQISEFLILRTL